MSDGLDVSADWLTAGRAPVIMAAIEAVLW